MGLPSPAWDTNPVQTLMVAGLVAIWHHLPFTFLVLYVALSTVPREALEAADMDGASGWQKFRQIEIPLIVPAMMIAILFRYIYAICMFSEVWLLTQGGPARLSTVLAIYRYRETFKCRDFGTASATELFMLVVVLLIADPHLRKIVRSSTTTSRYGTIIRSSSAASSTARSSPASRPCWRYRPRSVPAMSMRACEAPSSCSWSASCRRSW